jgi:putative LysE/RhtB family amino acid efflux pump
VHPAVVGFGLGFLVALQLGPMSLFLIRSTLRRGWAIGLAIGAGIAAVDMLYASLGAAGAAPLLAVPSLRLAGGLVGAAVLLWLGARTLWSAVRVRGAQEVEGDLTGPPRAFLTALGATASNPATIASWAAIFAAAHGAGAAGSATAQGLLVGGVALGSAAWVTTLATGTAIVRHAVGLRAMRAADAVAGVGLLGFGGALAYGTVENR